MKSVEIRSETRGGVDMSCVTPCHKMLQSKSLQTFKGQLEKFEGQKSIQVYQILRNSIQISKLINCSQLEAGRLLLLLLLLYTSIINACVFLYSVGITFSHSEAQDSGLGEPQVRPRTGVLMVFILNSPSSCAVPSFLVAYYQNWVT